MQTTPFLGLKKPDSNEYVSVTDLNDNSDTIDGAVNARVDAAGGDISETVIETLDTVEDKYPVPAAGESVKRFFGKVLTFLRNIRPLTSDITLYVSTTGSDILGDGTQLNPFRTIQHAIDVVPKDLGRFMATIIIGAGVYAETVALRNFHGGQLYLRSTNPGVVSDTATINYLILNYCTASMVFDGIKINNSTDESSILIYNCTNVLLNSLKITISAPTKYGVFCAQSNLVRIVNCDITGKKYAVSYHNTMGYVQSCTGANNSYACESDGTSIIQLIGTYPGSANGLLQTSGGSFVNQNGTQISGLITSGLTCTWGSLLGGYYRNGNSSGVAQVIINLRVTTTTQLTVGQQYSIGGFPIYGGGVSSVAVTVHNSDITSYCYINELGNIIFAPKINLVTGYLIIFTCTYITNS